MFPFLSLPSPFGVERRAVSGGRVFITQTSKEGRDSPALTVIHLVAFDGGLCGGDVCGIFRGDVVASWPLLPLRTQFIGLFCSPFFFCRANITNFHPFSGLSDTCPSVVSSHLPFNQPCFSTWSCRKENRRDEWSEIEKPTIQVFLIWSGQA